MRNLTCEKIKFAFGMNKEVVFVTQPTELKGEVADRFPAAHQNVFRARLQKPSAGGNGNFSTV